MTGAHDFATVSMDTWVNIQVVTPVARATVEPDVQRAFAWFETIERLCSRYDRYSEVMRLLEHVGEPVPVSTLLFEATAFALDLAEQTDGAFDPTLGAALERLGHDTHYVTGERVTSPAEALAASFRDIQLDRASGTIRLERPVVIDLNAVVKGLAIDLAARELDGYEGACVEAGGDIYARGTNADGEPWHIGIQDPRDEARLARTLRIRDAAVCTSGDYERGAHVLDGRTGRARGDLASVTVVAPTAMAADGLSTAAMALGLDGGSDLLRAQGVAGLFITHAGQTTTVGEL
jgi:thiamine biosynthesis lipoprotein